MTPTTKILLTTAILTTTLLLILETHQTPNKTQTPLKTESYTNYMFSTSWGGSICIFHNCSHYGQDKLFNLHGLWPGSSSTSPFNCYQTHFRESDFNTYIKQNIYKYWNSFYNPNWGFINHEITKHGTCWDAELGDRENMDEGVVKILENLDLESDVEKLNGYLETAIMVSRIVDPYGALEKEGIVPGEGREYSIEEIMRVFDGKYGEFSAIPICKSDRASGNMYMVELRFCLDLDYNPGPCENIGLVKSKRNYCRKSKITYPVFPN